LISRFVFATAFLLGATAIVAMGLAFVGSNPLGLMVTVVIAGVYAIGVIEILRFRQATATLSNALAGLSATAPEVAPDFLEHWLARLHPSLQNPVRLRIEGERVGLPAPVLTPYLVGLLVMLGLLGTFLGMVATLQGAVFALEGTTELQAIRAGLAAPIKGLALAFGTSVAGVAASAMLGLIATVSRRDRMSATRQLDSSVATVFRGFSLAHNRQQTFKAIQGQAAALPEVADRLQALATAIERMGNQLGEKLLANQAQFHESASNSYGELASLVERSLSASVAESGRQAVESGRLLGESVRPLLQALITDLARQTQTTHQQLALTVQQQLEGVTGSLVQSFDSSAADWLARQQAADDRRRELWTDSFAAAGERSRIEQQALTDSWQRAASEMANHSRASASSLLSEVGSLVHASEALVRTRIETEASWLQGHGERMSELTSTLRTELQALRNDEQVRGQAAVDQLAALTATITSQLASLGKELAEPMARLLDTATEAPRAAAEVMLQLRGELANVSERDNALLAERQRIMAKLDSLTASLQQVTDEQRQAVASLLDASVNRLDDVGARFSGQLERETSKLSGLAESLAGHATRIADDFAGSAVEMSSLGEAFTLAVKLFDDSNQKLVASLDRIEQSLARSSTRSDEQLAYYVAQARQIVDHSMLSQKEILDELRQLHQPGKSTSGQASETIV
jgi:hypothetical protein